MTNKFLGLGAALLLLSACGSTATPQPTSFVLPTRNAIAPIPTMTPTSEAISASYTPDKNLLSYLLVSVRYSMGQLGQFTDFSVTQEDSLLVDPPIQTESEPPPLYVVFKDKAGQILLRQSLPIVYSQSSMVTIDGGITVRWAVIIPNDQRYECAMLDPDPALPLSASFMTNTIAPPLHLCASQ